MVRDGTSKALQIELATPPKHYLAATHYDKGPLGCKSTLEKPSMRLSNLS